MKYQPRHIMTADQLREHFPSELTAAERLTRYRTLSAQEVPPRGTPGAPFTLTVEKITELAALPLGERLTRFRQWRDAGPPPD
jgi:hypothetical protein